MSIKLRTLVALTIAILIFILSGILSITISKRSGADIKKEIGVTLSQNAYQMADKLDYFMWSRYGEIKVLSELDQLKEQKHPESIEKMLNRLHDSIPSFSWIGLTDKKGNVIASTQGILKGKNIEERPVFQRAKKAPFIGDVHDAVLLAKLLPNPSGEPMQFVDISTPVYGKNGDFKGVLAAHLSWEWSKEIRDTVLQPMKSERGSTEIFIVSAKQNTILLGPKHLLGKPLHLKSVKQAQQKKNHWNLERWPDGKTYLTGYALGQGHLDYQGLGWAIIVRQSEDAAFIPAKNLQSFILFFGGICSVLFAIAGWLLAGKIAGPLQQITNAAYELRKGNKVEIPQVRGIKDIEVLSSSLRNLVASLSETESELGRMEDLAHNDALTGLPNRLSLYLQVEQAIRRARVVADGYFTLLFMDLDGFKYVNDTYGHHIGDELLKEVGKRLKRSLRKGEYVARLGGDEFVLLIESSSGEPIEEGKRIGSRTISVLNERFMFNGNSLTIGCSIGGAVWPMNGEDIEDVMKLADQALYLSKKSGKNQVNFIDLPSIQAVQ
ncbi:diguanylate cyclase domain-containing protein [Fictibacillus sp. KU28468]|uniref:sensor domain-containing diguanylate cyclase n=1 Tax=Fictibacillus sp. KU28468 TaxID=2991053 RepID=UPI00223CBFA9|nr:diguanylate cyclase [Fictibacillus sp. KU28468]UZJ77975.1 diguanylate cyclase [Fictibacillus sp. KU28468]